MLTTLSIRQIALIDQLELDFAAGMTALTGETGAGKSILIDAIGLLLGDRANMNLLRAGFDQGDFTWTDGETICGPGSVGRCVPAPPPRAGASAAEPARGAGAGG